MPTDRAQARILILAPTGCDEEILRLVLARERLVGEACDSLAGVVEGLADGGAGALILAEEALRHGAEVLTGWIERQPAWSDLPILLLRSDLAPWHGEAGAAGRAFERLGNISLLERPLRAETLISAVRSALRARQRQYQLRAHLVERDDAEARLRALNATLEERVAQAVAERRAAEAALVQAQKMEALGRLTGGVAHDFNNLLTAILGNLELLQVRLGPDHPEYDKLIEGALHGAQRGTRLTRQLLTFGRKQSLKLRPVDIGRVIAGMRELLDHTIGAAARIETDLAEDLWPAQVDEDNLVLVILNLVINARDAMPCGGTMRLTTRNVPDRGAGRPVDLGPGDFVELALADNGVGISEDNLEKVFEPFFTTKEQGKGTGLGLSEVYGLTKQIGGTVAIASRVGEGTTVRVYLPRAAGPARRRRTETSLRQRAESIVRHPRKAGRKRPANTRKGVILVVDDDPDVRGVTARYLDSLGFTVFEAGGGRAALDRLRSEPVDLLIADLVMPEMDGIELLRRARAEHPHLAALLVTGYAKDRALPETPDIEVLRKPFRLAELGARVDELLRGNAEDSGGS
ncbi:MAG TPA: ATP-binding protein [Stellaceae bacterium]|nr:ATP-binding protein [Stellaceae bacterium]